MSDSIVACEFRVLGRRALRQSDDPCCQAPNLKLRAATGEDRCIEWLPAATATAAREEGAGQPWRERARAQRAERWWGPRGRSLGTRGWG